MRVTGCWGGAGGPHPPTPLGMGDPSGLEFVRTGDPLKFKIRNRGPLGLIGAPQEWEFLEISIPQNRGSLRMGGSLGLGSLRIGDGVFCYWHLLESGFTQEWGSLEMGRLLWDWGPSGLGSLGIGVSPSGRKRTGRCRTWWRHRHPAAAEPSPSACRPGGHSKVTPKSTPWGPLSPPRTPHPPHRALSHPGHEAEGSNPTVLGGEREWEWAAPCPLTATSCHQPQPGALEGWAGGATRSPTLGKTLPHLEGIDGVLEGAEPSCLLQQPR